ncbi:MAG: hypothetical protein KDJ34_16660 [Candidatus Competibacteraceae bacterium]|nr:hypothetical protein [Candidatus Competibacteraceae bacterium]
MTNWAMLSFIDYLDAVDALLEERIGRTSTQQEMELIAAAQEGGESPRVCCHMILYN